METSMNMLHTMEDQALIETTRSLLPQVALYGEQIERERRLPQPLVESLAAAGVFKMLVPRSLGGFETAPETFCLILEELSRVDGSTGWSLLLSAMLGAGAAFLSED